VIDGNKRIMKLKETESLVFVQLGILLSSRANPFTIMSGHFCKHSSDGTGLEM